VKITRSTILLLGFSFIWLTISAAGLRAQGAAARTAMPMNNPPPTSPVTGDPANGKGLFFAYGCYACHGYNGETGARAFVGRWGHLANEQEFIVFLRGRANVAPENKSSSMPNFSDNTLSDKQAKDIYAHIRTFKSNAPELKDIPTLKAIVEAASKPAKAID
jgi:mono/diheme cytochrome c family protein